MEKTIKVRNRLFILILLIFCFISFNAQAQNKQNMEKDFEKMGFKKVSPYELQGNTFQMFAKQWALVSAGTENRYNTMTIGWGDFGVLWSKPVITVYVSSSRYTKSFLDENKFFTVEFFNENYRDALQYLGSHSGKDEDKIAKTNLTPIFTQKGNITFKESKIIIEAKKIYSHEFDINNLPEDVKTWYEKRKIGLHTMYIGEIENIWIKE